MQVVNNARIIRKDGSAPEYLEEDINDLALAQLLKKTYNYFKVWLFGSCCQQEQCAKLAIIITSYFTELSKVLWLMRRIQNL